MLIIDDDADAHFILKRQLSRLGCSVPIMGLLDGCEAVTYFQACIAGQQPFPSLVFLDIKMPGMNGFEVLQWMHERRLLGRVTVAMLSSSDDPKDVSRAMTLGAHTYLTKPPPPEVLLSLIQAAARLNTRKPAAPAEGAKRALVLKDADFERRSAVRLFELLGCDVIEAEANDGAPALLAEMSADVVFLDLDACEMARGVDLLKRLRANAGRARILVAASNPPPPVLGEAVAAVAAQFVAKPLNAERLGSLLQFD